MPNLNVPIHNEHTYWISWILHITDMKGGQDPARRVLENMFSLVVVFKHIHKVHCGFLQRDGEK